MSVDVESRTTDDHADDPSDGDDDGSRTPKADATFVPALQVPSLSLDGPSTESPSRDKQQEKTTADSISQSSLSMPPPPARPSAQTTSRAPRSSTTPSSLMPPPAPPSLRVPASGPRIPPLSAAAQARSGSTPSSNSSLSAPRTTITPSLKVTLKPGHSPLDWAALATTKNLSGVATLTRVTPSMLKQHNGRKGKPAWSSYLGKVYNISPYLPFHPGGEGQLMRGAGKDGKKLFMEAHPWVNWENMLSSCLVGVMVSEGSEAEEEGLDGID